MCSHTLAGLRRRSGSTLCSHGGRRARQAPSHGSRAHRRASEAELVIAPRDVDVVRRRCCSMRHDPNSCPDVESQQQVAPHHRASCRSSWRSRCAVRAEARTMTLPSVAQRWRRNSAISSGASAEHRCGSRTSATSADPTPRVAAATRRSDGGRRGSARAVTGGTPGSTSAPRLTRAVHAERTRSVPRQPRRSLDRSSCTEWRVAARVQPSPIRWPSRTSSSSVIRRPVPTVAGMRRPWRCGRRRRALRLAAIRRASGTGGWRTPRSSGPRRGASRNVSLTPLGNAALRLPAPVDSARRATTPGCRGRPSRPAHRA